MSTEWITPQLLKAALEAWQEEEDPPAQILTLRMIQRVGSSDDELSLAARQLIRALVADHLRLYRQKAGLPPVIQSSADNLLKGLRKDIEAARKPRFKALKFWSTLYYRFILETAPDLNTMAEETDCSIRSLRRYCASGLKALARVVRELERGNIANKAQVSSPNRLSRPEYGHLWGVNDIIGTVVHLLLDPKGPPFISIEGVSGIGKTVLTQEIARYLSRRDDITGVLWVSARQERFSEAEDRIEALADGTKSIADIIARIAQQAEMVDLAGLGPEKALERMEPLFASGRYIILLDNLDTFNDTHLLLPLLFNYSSSARYILTSRYTLGHYSYVHALKMSDLSYEDSEALVQQGLRFVGRTAQVSEKSMDAIYDAVGGIPLVLKYVARQMGHFPLQHVLGDLQSARSKKTEELYRYIYQNTWRLLDESARTLLLSLNGNFSAGKDISALRQQVSHLSDIQFDLALRQLLDSSLLHITGSLETPLYQFHPITRTFLNTGIHKKWNTG